MIFEVPERAQLELELRPPVPRDESAPLVCPECHRPFPRLDEMEPAQHSEPRETEMLAALRQRPKLGTARQKVLGAFIEADRAGATDEEVATTLQMRLYTAAPRRNELLRGGWIKDSGRVRPTTTGSPATVWELTEQARERLR